MRVVQVLLTLLLNDGTGADGVVGQTYVDSVTGLTFTILPRDGDLPYPSGANSALTFKVGPESYSER